MLRIASILLFLFISLNSYAQKSTELVKINGVKYYVHTVQKGHTLYAISKVYSIDIDDIIDANPGADDGLSIGEELLIPKKGINKKEAKKNPPQLIDGKLIHTVAIRETLYGIAGKYKISVEELVKQNPEVNDGLKVGMQIVVNQTTIEEIEQKDIKPALPDDYIEHVVEQKETLYGISKKYNIGIDSIVTINPALVEGLKVGMILYIPKTEEEFVQQQKDESIIYSGKFKESYNIALFLPFDLIETDTIILENKLRMKPMSFSQSTLVSVEYYRGFLMAVDSLKAQGLNANVFVHDLGNDLIKAQTYINNASLPKMDMIFGPFHLSTFELLSEFANQNQIKLVCPINHPNRVMLNKSEIFECVPSKTTQIRFIADYFSIDQDNYHTISIFEDDARSRIISDEFKKYTSENNIAAQHLILNPKIKPDAPKDRDVINSQFEHLINALDTLKLNRIFIASINDAFILPLFNLMNKIDTSIYKIQVFGLNDLYNSDQINNYYRHKYKLTLALTNYIDYSDPNTILFIEKYRTLYNTDPSSNGFAMRGFDNGYYFLKQLIDFGLNFEMILNQEGMKTGMQMKIEFVQVGTDSGFENKGMFLMQYSDYNLINFLNETLSEQTGNLEHEKIVPVQNNIDSVDDH
jgi:LysM repeat protein/ABC-type branched-subunit amino acid transport system substrate-binding protein